MCVWMNNGWTPASLRVRVYHTHPHTFGGVHGETEFSVDK